MPLLLDLLPLGLTLTRDDFVLAVCFDGAVLVSAETIGAVGVDPSVLGLVQVGVHETGRVFGAPAIDGSVRQQPTTTGAPIQVSVVGEILGAPAATGDTDAIGVTGPLLDDVALSGPITAIGAQGAVLGLPRVSGPVTGPCD